jgi:Skp family chaperone for outer membrane proteins
LVLNWGLSGEGVLYGTDSRDITTEVLEALNVPK